MPIARSSRPLVAQFVKFGIVGVSNTLLTFAVYTLLLKIFGVWYLAASGHRLRRGSRQWLPAQSPLDLPRARRRSLTPVRWFLVQGGGLLVNLGLVYLFVEHAGLDKLLGQACATAIVVVLTFFANRAWTFRMRPAGGHARPRPAPTPARCSAVRVRSFE